MAAPSSTVEQVPVKGYTVSQLRERLHQALETIATVDGLLVPMTGGLTLTESDCSAYEAVLGAGSCQSASHLLAALTRHASIGIGKVVLDLTPAQLEEVKYRAKKNNRSPKDEMQAAVARIQDLVFGSGYIAPS